MKIRAAVIFFWIILLSGVFYLLKNVRSKWVWGTIFIVIGAFGFVKFIKWVSEQEGES